MSSLGERMQKCLYQAEINQKRETHFPPPRVCGIIREGWRRGTAADQSLSLCWLCQRSWWRKRQIWVMSWRRRKRRGEWEGEKKVRVTCEDMLWLLPRQGRVNYGWPPLSCRVDGGSAAFCCSTLDALMFYYCWRMRCSAAATLSDPNELSDMRS